jgi:F-type H+-transporting ATPase subunit delta
VNDRNLTVARVYAAALVGIGRETGSLAAIQDDLVAVRRLFDEDRWFRRFFTSPRIDRAVKWKALRSAFTGKCGRPMIGLLKVLVDKGREPLFDGVVDEFMKLKDAAENRIHAYVVVAKPLADELRRAIASRLETSSGKTVVFHERVDPSVIGGASIRVGDRVIDRTLKTKLAALKKQLLAN